MVVVHASESPKRLVSGMLNELMDSPCSRRSRAPKNARPVNAMMKVADSVAASQRNGTLRATPSLERVTRLTGCRRLDTAISAATMSAAPATPTVMMFGSAKAATASVARPDNVSQNSFCSTRCDGRG